MSSPQLPLALRFPPDQRFDGFISAVAGAVPLLAAVARGERADWVLLAGAAGSGKTHLLLAACAEAEAHGRRAAYVPLAQSAGQAATMLAGLDDARLLAIDGIEHVLGNRDDEVALFGFHNRARAAGAAVLYAAASALPALAVGLPDLRSRLGQCTQVALPLLDDAGRRAVLRLRAERRGLELDEAVLDFLLRRVGRDLATLTTLLDRIDRASLAAQRRVTVPFLRTLLREPH